MKCLRLAATLTSVVLSASWAHAQPARPSRLRPAARTTAMPRFTPAPTPAPTATPTPVAGLAVSHEEKTCWVAGRYPQLRACFAPATELAKAEMYFRPDKAAHWYRVAFKPEGECSLATLPKPSKALVGTSVLLYAAATSRQWGESRTREYAAHVVETENECGERPVAPYVPSASVQVLPSLPAGFTVGGVVPVPLILGGVAAAGGGAAFAAASGGGEPPMPTTVTPTPTSPATTITPTPTPTPGSDLPPTLACRTVPDPAEGPAPLSVELNLCRSEDPEGRPLTYRFDFGDGGSAGGFCRETHTYASVGTFTARMCVTDGTHAEQCCSETIRVTAGGTPPPTTGGGSCPAPSIVVDDPKPGFSVTVGGTVTVRTTPSASAGIGKVEFRATNTSTGATTGQTVTAAPWQWDWRTSLTGVGPSTVTATVFDRCASGAQTASASVSGNVTTFILAPEEGSEGMVMSAELDVPEGRAQIVLDESHQRPLRAGRSGWIDRVAPGTRRVDGMLLQAAGPGLWRFQLRGGRFRAGSVRIREGELSLLAPDALVFRSGGRAGERVSFTFELAP